MNMPYATEVEIRFLAQGAAATTIEIEHRGWERLGSDGAQWRDRTRAGWRSLPPHFAAAIAKGAQRWPLAPRTTRGS